jgi:anti-anti-sigma factor
MMNIVEAQYGNATVLYPDGRIDFYSVPIFEEKLLDAISSATEAVIVDCSKIPYTSSVGVRAIMIAAKRSKAADISLSVTAMTPTVKEIFKISRLDDAINIFENLQDAVAAVSDEALSAFLSEKS